MDPIRWIKSIFEKRFKKIEAKMLPSQGFFYGEDFEMSIKKVGPEEVSEYELGYNPEDLGMVLGKLKKIVMDNIILSKGYSFNNIKSIDVVFIFLEIVSFTKGSPIRLEYYNDETGMIDFIPFSQSSFNYFNIGEDLMKKYLKDERCFCIGGYKFTLPSIGIENSLTNYLIMKSSEIGSEKYNEYSYNFTYFLGNKEFITFSEVENLIEIFNCDMDENDKKMIGKIVECFFPMQRYSLLKDGKAIEMSSKINLKEIWR